MTARPSMAQDWEIGEGEDLDGEEEELGVVQSSFWGL